MGILVEGRGFAVKTECLVVTAVVLRLAKLMNWLIPINPWRIQLPDL
jgi:hypothetical protein